MNKYKRFMVIAAIAAGAWIFVGCGNSAGADNNSAQLQKDYLEQLQTKMMLQYDTSLEEDTEDTAEEDNNNAEPEAVVLEPVEEEPDTVASADAYEITTESIGVNGSWQYADSTVINWGSAVLYKRSSGWNGITVGVNAGHGTSGSTNYQTYCHPDRTAKVTGGTTAAGSITAVAVSTGMTFNDGTPERDVNLRVAEKLKDKLLDYGYNVLMIRDGDDVQLDNVARTVICNNMADCHVAIHFDGDGLSYDKGAFFMSVPDALKYMEPVSYTWEKSENLGWSLIQGLENAGVGINGGGSMDMDLTQTSYSTVASVDIELGNACSDIGDAHLETLATGLFMGINIYFGK